MLFHVGPKLLFHIEFLLTFYSMCFLEFIDLFPLGLEFLNKQSHLGSGVNECYSYVCTDLLLRILLKLFCCIYESICVKKILNW